MTADRVPTLTTTTAPPPTGAPLDWLESVRAAGSRGKLQSFPVFDAIFDYRDIDGIVTPARRVTAAVMEINSWGGAFRPGLLYVTGWCHLRREIRTFREDQMDQVTDPLTGEMPANPRTWFLSRAKGG